jgi:hypothetical protein
MSIEFLSGAVTGWVSFVLWAEIIKPIFIALYRAWRRK